MNKKRRGLVIIPWNGLVTTSVPTEKLLWNTAGIGTMLMIALGFKSFAKVYSLGLLVFLGAPVRVEFLATSLAGLIVADYFVVSRHARAARPKEVGSINLAAVLTIAIVTYLAPFALRSLMPMEFFLSLLVSLFVYQPLRTLVFSSPTACGR